MDNVGLVVAASMLLALLILVARELRRRLGIFRWFFIPTSVIAGLLGLCLGPQVVGRLYEEGTLLSQGVFPPAVVETWRQMPGILINFVFAAMFLGKALPPRRSLWRSGGPQTLLGCAIAFGHYALGLFAVLVILRPLTGITPLSGMLLEISLSGGHGTAAGLTAVFTELGFPEGLDMALGLATIGLLSAVIFGTLFINIALRSDAITIAREEFTKDEERYELSALQDNENIEVKSASDTTSDPLTIHFALL
ncbi:MAG: hypothetical protein GX117_07510 [Candidatus Hydrogenedentes bacterium]|nr:hypothetical protein [Candidatus Hydrogenedentota bacterium]